MGDPCICQRSLHWLILGYVLIIYACDLSSTVLLINASSAPHEPATRASGQLEMRSLMTGKEGEGKEGKRRIPGIAEARYKVLPKPYNDGKECGTGQDPFNKAETKLALKYYEGLGEKKLKKDKDKKGRENGFLVLMYEESKEMVAENSPNCRSKKCHLDVVRLSYVCGAAPVRSFKDGTHCRDGSEVREDPLKSRKGRTISSFVQDDYNEKATELYGKFCKSKKCYFHFHKDALICRGSSVSTSVLLLIPLIAFVHWVIRDF